MPRKTERQQLSDALLKAALVQLVVEAEEAIAAGDDDTEGADVMLGEDEGSEDEDLLSPPMFQELLESYASLLLSRYLNKRMEIKKTPVLLDLLLDEWKQTRPEIFRSYMRMTPACFDHLVETIHSHPVFHNHSSNEQMPVEWQVAITLYRFGHYSNAASIMKTGLWAGVGYGTVKLVTFCVMQACCDKTFRQSALRWPDAEAKERAKEWVEKNSCPAWQNGYLMIDGTLFPFYVRPSHFGNTWFDRKSNYSMNAQVRDLKTLHATL